jgi:hypothetical protein
VKTVVGHVKNVSSLISVRYAKRVIITRMVNVRNVNMDVWTALKIDV